MDDNFLDVMHQFQRMCHKHITDRCVGCPMSCVNIAQCRKYAFEHPKVFESRVLEWAGNNPEPIYPTWGQWFITQNLITIDRSGHYLPGDLFETRIPEWVGTRLGIEPENGRLEVD